MKFKQLQTLANNIAHLFRGWVISTCLFIALVSHASAAEVVRVQVDQNGDIYTTQFEISLNAPADSVRRVLTDIDQLIALLPDVKEYMVKRQTNSNKADVQLVMRTCVLSLCKEFTQKEHFDIGKDGQLKGRFIPVGSDFVTGQSAYQVIEDKNGTRIQFNASMNPKFWVPLGETVLTYCLTNYAQKLAYAIDQHVSMQAKAPTGKYKKPA